MQVILISAAIAVVVTCALLRWSLSTSVVVEDFEDAILVRDGRVVQDLGSGRRRVWRRGDEISKVDLREQQLLVGGQEVLTADGVPLKVSVTVTFRLLGARAQRGVADSSNALWLAAQHALRNAACQVSLQEVLDDRAALDARMTAELRGQAQRLALAEVQLALKDLMVGGDLKRSLADVAKVRFEGRARLERVRSETAALRGLANAARLLEDNKGLAQLQLIQTAQAVAAGEGNQLVLHIDPDANAS